MRKVLVGLSVVMLHACNGAWGTTHCDFRDSETPPRCQEREGAMGGAFQQICGQTKGTPGDGECPRENLIAGCVDPSAENPAQHVVDWYYFHSDPVGTTNITSRDDVKKKCDEDGYDTVDP